MPASLRTPQAEPKGLLKPVAERHLPKEWIFRPKRGFSMPLDRWLAGPLAPLVRDLLLDPQGLAGRGLLQPSWLQRLVDYHLAGLKGHGTWLWVLLQLELWCGKCV